MKGRRGFTLIEMLIVITVVGVLLAVLVPRYGTIAAAMNVHSAKQEISSMLSQARATAVQRERTVRVIRTSNVISLYSVNGATLTVIRSRIWERSSESRFPSPKIRSPMTRAARSPGTLPCSSTW